MIEVAYTNIHSKTKIYSLLPDSFTLRCSPGMSTLILLQNTVVDVLVILINADTRIKEVQKETMKLNNKLC